MKRLLLILVFLTGCNYSAYNDSPPKMNSITIVDSNGFTETITSKDRLQQYSRVDFAKPQSFQKVLRVFGRDATGNVRAALTSYHPNGQLKQYLEAKNNSASGSYREWYPSGRQKLDVTVISGVADLTPAAEQTWLFDGTSKAWEEDGSLAAIIQYNKGVLDGLSVYYHPSGNLWKRIPYEQGQVNGVHEIYLDNGEFLQKIEYKKGIKHGTSLRYWSGQKIASEEHYDNGLLITANYFNKEGSQVAEIAKGNGYRALFGLHSVAELQKYQHGEQMGEVKVFDNSGTIVNLYHTKNGLKHGQEIEYQEKKLGINTVKPKLSVNWFQGCIQGIAKTWYDNGVLESQRELSSNRKNGLSTAWYRDGSLMMIEEYEQDILVRGEYYKIGDKKPFSRVWEGSGVATLFDSEGNFARKVNYHHGKPQE